MPDYTYFPNGVQVDPGAGVGLKRTGQTKKINAGGKVGATAGWTTNNNLSAYRVPASQTAVTLTIPVSEVKKGWVLTGFRVLGQIESGGNTVTLDADLRKTTAAAADLTDASIGAITQISKTADYKITDTKTGLSATVADDEAYYVLLTATTGIATDIDLQGIELFYDEY